MILAYHSIFCAYGFWLPNDPRGSWSDIVRSWELAVYGDATKTDTRRSVAANPHDHELRKHAKLALKYPPVVFTGEQALAVAHGFAEMVRVAGYTIHACSILPEHVHMVIARHRYTVEKVVARLKGRATDRLVKEGLHPFGDEPRFKGRLPSPWARNAWHVYLDSDADIRRAIGYVENNPVKERKAKQEWKFVTKYEGLPAA